MKVEFEIDVPKTPFKVGDRIKIKNVNDHTDQYVLISKVIFTGTWVMCEECGMANASMDRYNYEGVIQLGSYTLKNFRKIPIRPGTRMVYPGFKLTVKDDINILDSIFTGEKLEKFPHKEVSIDTKENINKREIEWRSTCSAIAKSGDWDEYANKCQQE